MLQSL